MSTRACHLRLLAPYQSDREVLWNELAWQDTTSCVVDCRRALRGPYTGTGSLLRQLVPVIFACSPELVDAHIVEILSIAPELKALVSATRQTLTSLAVPEERTRFYSRTRTLRLTHGLIDLLKSCLETGVFEHLVLYFDQVQAADTLDQEFLRELLRRANPAQITVVIGTTGEEVSEPLQKALASYTDLVERVPLSGEGYAQTLQALRFPAAWQDWLLAYSRGYLGEYGPLSELLPLLEACQPEAQPFAEGMQKLVEQASDEQRETWARAFIASVCTSDVELERQAYALLDDATRRRWHDERAEILEQEEDWSLRLGALPYHREHGSSPEEQGAAALQKGLDYCIDMGYYEATIDFGYRGRAVIDWQKQLSYYWTFTTKNTTSLAALERAEEAEGLYDEARAFTTEPGLHMQAAYATAMLYTRHHRDEKRNNQRAKAWINEAIAIARLFPDPKTRAFNVVFNQNGLALVESHMKRPQEALRLVTEGLERLNRELEPGEHLLHRSVLLYNRAQVYAGIGELEKALADYTAVIEQDPYYSEYHFDRGNVLRRLHREEEALAEYELAIRYSPPYPEAYYNRASVLAVLGEEDRALADYSYILEIEPTHLDSLINRASIFYERGLYDEARQDISQGLALEPGNAALQCTLGLIEMAEEHPTEAYQAFTTAVESDPSLVAAWTNRAILAFEQGQLTAAVEDLTHALALEQNATVLYNRGIAYQEQGLWQQALDDFTSALALSEEDEEDLLARRNACAVQLGYPTKSSASARGAAL